MKIKNVFFNQLEGMGIKIAEKLRDKWEIENIYTVILDQHKEELRQSSLLPIIREKVLFVDAQTANYDNYLFYDEMVPLDNEILDKMALYESEVLKMMDRMITPDRSMWMRMAQYHEHVRYWNTFLDRAGIQVYIHNNVAHDIYDHVIFRLCKIKGIPTLTCDYIPIDCEHVVFPFYSYYDFDESIPKRVKQYAESGHIELSENLEKEYQIHTTSNKPIVDGAAKVPGGFKRQMQLFKDIYKRDKGMAMKKTFVHFFDRHKVNSLIKYYGKLAVRPDYLRRFIYFPLHVQPEASTSPIGGWYVHQYIAIQMISYCLPKDIYIYVKEHPSMGTLAVNSRVKEDYDLLLRMENVQLIPMSASTYELADHCLAVASITGTAGYEAMYKGKPFLMFGDQFFKYAPNTLNIRTLDDCSRAIEIVSGDGMKISENDMRAFLKVVDEVGIKNRWRKESAQSPEAVKTVDDFVERYDQMLRSWIQ